MIDFHTHIFPDEIAGKTLEFLSSVSKTKPCTDGTNAGLLTSTREAKLSCSVVLPVVTKPSQFQSINQFAAQFQSGELISFGGIHPASEHYKEELKQIKAYGLKGIKLHPDYQNTYFNDIRYKRIVACASELDLIVSVHAGVDVGFPNDVHCTPQMAKEVLDEVRPQKLVLAHLGGFSMWKEVEELLVGAEVYLDTAFIFDYIEQEQFLRIVRRHGMKKILFATDSPWASQSHFVKLFDKMGLTEEEKEWIGHKNAERLLFGKGTV